MKPGTLLSRLAALALAIAVLASIVWTIVLPTLAEHEKYDQLIENALSQKTQFEALGVDPESADADLDGSEPGAHSTADYLPEPGAALAGAALVGRIDTIVAQHGGALVSTRILGDQSDQDAPSVTVRAQMKASIGGLRSILHELETGSPALFLDDVLVSADSVTAPGRNLASVDADPAEPLLDALFSVTGYLAPERTP